MVSLPAVSLQNAQALAFPPPPAGKTGWPWQVEPAAAPPDAAHWPRISVITPSFNQGQFLEQTLRSVLLQGYPNLEYIVIDGGSTDESVAHLRRYEPWLSYWVSERDRGQSHAINKGFQRATGEILCWLNSDDYFPPDTLRVVAETLAAGTGNFALLGDAVTDFQDGRAPVFERGAYVNRRRLLEYWRGYPLHQPSIFWRREVFEKVGLLREDLHLIMDFDYWARIAEHFHFVKVERVLSHRNHHDAAKTSDNCASYFADLRRRRHDYWGSKTSLDYWWLTASLAWHERGRPLAQRLTTPLRRVLR